MRVGVGTDRGGFGLKEVPVARLRAAGHVERVAAVEFQTPAHSAALTELLGRA
jgi:hypothetical protein